MTEDSKEKKLQTYRNCNRRYYKRHREEILANKPKKYCKYCEKTMYTYYYLTKHVNLDKHINKKKEYKKAQNQ